MEKPQSRPGQGMSAGSSAQVTQLARQVSQMSRIEARSSDSTITPSGFGAIKEGGPLDPFSDNFDSLAWSKWFYELYQQDAEGNPDRHCGFSAKKLSVHGFGTGAEYQPTVGNMPLSLMGDLISSLQPSRPQKIQILKDFHCLIEPGELLVVLGPPGSGCSTFLKTIAGETNGIYIDEQAELNYHGISNEEMHKVYRGESIYCAEVESNFAALTVGDTLQFAAECRTPEKPPAGINRREFATHVRDVIMALLGISHTINTKVGSDIIRGVSGGERKRVSIAETMLAGSSLQCWDNSTRGLDSATAVQFCKSLRLSADVAGSTASVAIYQSPQSAYEQFDKVTVLYEGQQIYFGPAGDARAFFEEMGFQPMQGQSTPDFLTSLTNPAERQVKKGFEESVPKTAIEFAQRWKESSTFADLVSQIDKYNNDHPIGGEGSKAFGASRRAQQFKSNRADSPYILSYRQQVSICLRRNWWRIAAQPDQPIFELSGNIILSLLSSSLFYNLSDSSSSFQSRAAVLFLATLLNAFASALEILNMYIQRPIVEKHARYAFYHPSAEAFSSFISSLPYKIVNVTLTSLIWYFMTNLNRTAGHFFFYLFVGFLACVTMSMFFRTVAALSRSLIQAMVPAGIVIVALVVYSGFVIPVRNMRGWSKWMWYIDPIAYAYEALLLNELAGRQFACDSYVPTGPGYPEPGSEQTTCSTVGSEPGNPFVSGDRYLLESYEYVNGHKWRNVGIVIAFILGLFVVYLVASEYITEKKSKGEVLVWPRGHNAIARPDDIEANKEIATTNTTKGENANRQEALKQLPRQATFSWSDVCYDVKIKSETRRILDHVDGWVKPGQLTALMGVSGAGKTTLLDLLATRITMGVVAGEKLVDGRPCDRSFQRKTGYVQQQDLHQATATVREALTFSALLRQPASVSKEEKLEYVEEVLRLLEMEAYADAVVGIPGEGLNVEQRKRLTIGVELAAKPDLLLFLDEPTSGLDAQTSWSICSLLEKLSKNGQAILCTIHQPSAQLFERFDRLLFLAKGGRTVYFGEVGSNSKILIDYFVSKGAEECPPQDNPAEWMLKVIGAAPGSHTEIDWHKTWNESEEKKAVKAELADMKANGGNATADHSQPDDDREFAASTMTQFVEATKRIAQAYWRTPTYFYSKFILVVGTALFIGFSFLKSSEISQREIQNQILSIFILFSIFSQIIEQTTPEYLSIRALYEVRERSSKTYSWWIFLTSHMLIEFGVTILVAIPVFLSWYYPVGFSENADVTGTTHERGILMLLLVIAYLLYAASFGYLTIAAVELADIAGAICNLLFVMMLVFCGVLIPKNSMPGFWKFMYWVVPFTYLGEGMLVTGVDNIPITCSSEELLTIVTPAGQTCAAYLESYISMAGGYIPQNLSAGECQYCPVSNSRDILSNFSMEYGHRWRNLGIMFIYIFANVGATYALYYFFRVPKNRKPSK